MSDDGEEAGADGWLGPLNRFLGLDRFVERLRQGPIPTFDYDPYWVAEDAAKKQAVEATKRDRARARRANDDPAVIQAERQLAMREQALLANTAGPCRPVSTIVTQRPSVDERDPSGVVRLPYRRVHVGFFPARANGQPARWPARMATALGNGDADRVTFAAWDCRPFGLTHVYSFDEDRDRHEETTRNSVFEATYAAFGPADRRLAEAGLDPQRAGQSRPKLLLLKARFRRTLFIAHRSAPGNRDVGWTEPDPNGLYAGAAPLPRRPQNEDWRFVPHATAPPEQQAAQPLASQPSWAEARAGFDRDVANHYCYHWTVAHYMLRTANPEAQPLSATSADAKAAYDNARRFPSHPARRFFRDSGSGVNGETEGYGANRLQDCASPAISELYSRIDTAALHALHSASGTPHMVLWYRSDERWVSRCLRVDNADLRVALKYGQVELSKRRYGGWTLTGTAIELNHERLVAEQADNAAPRPDDGAPSAKRRRRVAQGTEGKRWKHGIDLESSLQGNGVFVKKTAYTLRIATRDQGKTWEMWLQIGAADGQAAVSVGRCMVIRDPASIRLGVLAPGRMSIVEEIAEVPHHESAADRLLWFNNAFAKMLGRALVVEREDLVGGSPVVASGKPILLDGLQGAVGSGALALPLGRDPGRGQASETNLQSVTREERAAEESDRFRIGTAPSPRLAKTRPDPNTGFLVVVDVEKEKKKKEKKKKEKKKEKEKEKDARAKAKEKQRDGKRKHADAEDKRGAAEGQQQDVRDRQQSTRDAQRFAKRGQEETAARRFDQERAALRLAARIELAQREARRKGDAQAQDAQARRDAKVAERQRKDARYQSGGRRFARVFRPPKSMRRTREEDDPYPDGGLDFVTEDADPMVSDGGEESPEDEEGIPSRPVGAGGTKRQRSEGEGDPGDPADDVREDNFELMTDEELRQFAEDREGLSEGVVDEMDAAGGEPDEGDDGEVGAYRSLMQASGSPPPDALINSDDEDATTQMGSPDAASSSSSAWTYSTSSGSITFRGRQWDAAARFWKTMHIVMYSVKKERRPAFETDDLNGEYFDEEEAWFDAQDRFAGFFFRGRYYAGGSWQGPNPTDRNRTWHMLGKALDAYPDAPGPEWAQPSEYPQDIIDGLAKFVESATLYANSW